jgi:hypothetical protein
MKNVSSGLLLISGFLMFAYVGLALMQLVETTFDRFYHRYIRKLRPEQYIQSVLLPLYGAVVGGLLSTGITVLVDPPPGNHVSSALLGSFLLAAAIGIGVIVPLRANITYENRTNMLIGLRIDQLKNGDWARDTKADVLKTIEQDKAAITKNLNDLNPLFLILIAFLAASDVDWLIFHHHMHTLTTGVETIVIVIVVGAIVAQYWVWPKALRGALAELNSYRAEADKLIPPTPVNKLTPLTPVNATVVHHHHHHNLWVAVGGLIIGALLTRVGVPRRREQRSARGF